MQFALLGRPRLCRRFFSRQPPLRRKEFGDSSKILTPEGDCQPACLSCARSSFSLFRIAFIDSYVLIDLARNNCLSESAGPSYFDAADSRGPAEPGNDPRIIG